MFVKELRKKLEVLEALGLGNVPIEIEDSCARVEGYGDSWNEYATSPILGIMFRDGKMCLEADEIKDEE